MEQPVTTRRRPPEGDAADGPVAETAALILFYQSTLDAMSPNVAVLNRSGEIIAVNTAWRRFLSDNNLTDPDFHLGGNYLDLCERAEDKDSLLMAERIQGLIAGGPGPVRHDYRCRWTGGRTWSRMSAVRVGRASSPYVILSHEDISAKLGDDILRREMSGRLLLAEDEERRRIGRDIHDGAAQKLAAAKLMLARGEAGAVDAKVLLAEAIEDLRALADRLHPPMLEPLGLCAALRRLAGRFGREAGIEMVIGLPESFPRLARPVEITLYRAAQEGLENVHRHSGSARAELSLIIDDDDRVRLCVRDHGRGLAEAADVGEGLAGLRLRVEQLGGRTVLQEVSPGAELLVELPVLEAVAGEFAASGG